MYHCSLASRAYILQIYKQNVANMEMIFDRHFSSLHRSRISHHVTEYIIRPCEISVLLILGYIKVQVIFCPAQFLEPCMLIHGIACLGRMHPTCKAFSICFSYYPLDELRPFPLVLPLGSVNRACSIMYWLITINSFSWAVDSARIHLNKFRGVCTSSKVHAILRTASPFPVTTSSCF